MVRRFLEKAGARFADEESIGRFFFRWVFSLETNSSLLVLTFFRSFSSLFSFNALRNSHRRLHRPLLR